MAGQCLQESEAKSGAANASAGERQTPGPPSVIVAIKCAATLGNQLLDGLVHAAPRRVDRNISWLTPCINGSNGLCRSAGRCRPGWLSSAPDEPTPLAQRMASPCVCEPPDCLLWPSRQLRNARRLRKPLRVIAAIRRLRLSKSAQRRRATYREPMEDLVAISLRNQD